jgi:hypothetical protein
MCELRVNCAYPLSIKVTLRDKTSRGRRKLSGDRAIGKHCILKCIETELDQRAQRAQSYFLKRHESPSQRIGIIDDNRALLKKAEDVCPAGRPYPPIARTCSYVRQHVFVRRKNNDVAINPFFSVGPQ